MEASDAAIFVLARIVRRESDEEEAPKFCARIGEELKERKEEGLGFRRLLHCCRGAKRSVSEEHLKALPIEHAIFDEMSESGDWYDLIQHFVRSDLIVS
jgi:hypothetical protein